MWAGDVQPGPGQAGRAAVIDDAAVRRLYVAAVDDRPHHRLCHRREEFGISWPTVSAIAMRATADLIAAAGPDRLTGIRVIGVDEHRWAPRRVGPAGFVTLIIDLTPTHRSDRPGAAARPGRRTISDRAGVALAAQPASFAQAVEVIAMDGFAGYRPPPPRFRLS